MVKLYYSFLLYITQYISEATSFFLLLLVIILFLLYNNKKERLKLANEKLNSKRIEGQLEALMKNLPYHILSIDLRGKVTYANKPMLNKKKNEIIGENISELFGNQFLQKYLYYVRNINQITPTEEKTYEYNGGFYTWRLLPVNWAGEGEVLLLARNINRRVTLEKALIESNLNFEGFVQALPGVAYRKELTKGKNENYTFISHRVLELTGYSEEDFSTHKVNWNTLIDKADIDRVKTLAASISPTKPGFSIEYKIRTRNGGEKWLLNQAHTTFSNNKPIRREGVILDITHQKESENEILKLHKELKELKFAIDNTSLVTITDKTGRIKYVNDKFIEISGYSREESIGEKHNLVNASYHPREFWADLWCTISSGKVWSGEIKNRAKNGTYYWVHTFIVPIKDANNKIKEYLSIRNDITDKKNQEEENKLLSLVAKETSNYVMITDSKGKIEWVNQAFERGTGYKLEEIQNKKPGDFLQGEKTSEKTIQKIRNGLREEKNFTAEVLNYTKDKKPYWVSINFQPIFDEKGKLIKYFSLMRNITLHKELVQKLETAVKKAEKSDQLKTTFLANISHEVRTPMNAIIGFSELMSMKTVSEEKVKYYSNIINTRSKDLLSIFNDMLDTSKLVSGQAQLNISTGSVENLLKNIFTLHNNSHKKLISNQIKFSLNIDENIFGLSVDTDFIKLNQVIENLITNAIKFTDKGSIEYGCRKTNDDQLLFYVSDTGIGIDQNLNPSIFEAFRQVEDTHIKHGGSGLGLAICKGYVNLMGGEIWFESKDVGTNFYFRIPINYASS
ncbi:PAS domain-containing sensor histidine kinase [Marivirga arenosa]|uniref:histidine kinase n=1 Tax=Marivirga arenosa TaxID=3059076 RepID=A0AA51ZXI2_9BACT|nr:PAS domain S-box protein [Marivirga sp. BKB1-2]WNB18584.1 PAS domain S-box protein [Marivirga sp. BKB1-2]